MRFGILSASTLGLFIAVGLAAAQSGPQSGAQSPPAPPAPGQSPPSAAQSASRPAPVEHVVPLDSGGRVKLIDMTPQPGAGPGGSAAPVTGAWYVVDQPFFDFGNVWQNENVTHSFEIKNTSKDHVLEVSDVKADCHCTTPGDYEHRIEPGQTGHVTFTLHTSGLGNQLTKGAAVTTNDPKQPMFRVTMQGFCKTLTTLTPNSGGSFGEIIDQDDERVSDMVMASNLTEPLKLELMPVNGKPPFSLTMKEEIPGKQWKLSLKTVPPLPAGSQSYPFRIKTNHEKIPFLPIVASYFRPERVAARPLNVRFPDVVEAGQPNAAVDIMNHGKTPVHVTSAETPDEPRFKVSVLPKMDGAMYSVEISAPVGYKLEGATNLLVHTDDAEFKDIKVPIWSMASRGKTHPATRARELREQAAAQVKASTQQAPHPVGGNAAESKYKLRGKPSDPGDAGATGVAGAAGAGAAGAGAAGTGAVGAGATGAGAAATQPAGAGMPPR